MGHYKVIEGVGFGAKGEEDDYILLIDDEVGSTTSITATNFIPTEAVTRWAHLESLIGGFGEDRSAERLAENYADVPRPRAYRLRITVDAEPLTSSETDALLARARSYNRARDRDPC